MIKGYLHEITKLHHYKIAMAAKMEDSDDAYETVSEESEEEMASPDLKQEIESPIEISESAINESSRNDGSAPNIVKNEIISDEILKILNSPNSQEIQKVFEKVEPTTI